MPASHAGGIKTDAGEQADAERQAKKRLGVGSAGHRILHILSLMQIIYGRIFAPQSVHFFGQKLQLNSIKIYGATNHAGMA